MFSDKIESLNIEEWVSASLYAKPLDLQKIISKSKFSISDLPYLLSPAAENVIETIAQKSSQLTKQRFGKTMQLFIPMYLSNECYNTCTYCGFSKEHKYERVTLSDEQINKELTTLKEKGFQHILLLTGESPKKVGADYIKNAVKLTSKKFDSIGIEVQPLKQHEYEEIILAGADSLTLYQETYHYESYLKYHLSGIKRQYKKRLDAVEAGAKAGFFRINLGILCGLYDWRYDAIALAHHINYLQKKYWKTKFAVSFPRINEMIGEFKVGYQTNTIQLVQMICAFRLIFPDITITLSTREPAVLRDKLIHLGITQISAESNTSPGGYSTCSSEKQFEISDERSLDEIKNVLLKNNFEPVMKDWDKSLQLI
tara:strand:- start:1107 stop:2216 length:1110 start_codon:yes stop_codon:yes gene_type:complete